MQSQRRDITHSGNGNEQLDTVEHNVQGQVGHPRPGFEKPRLVKSVPAHGRGAGTK